MSTVLNSKQSMEQEIARLKAELERATAKKSLTFKVSEKGAVSVYGLGRFPVTLYSEQWVRLFKQVSQISDFMELNKATIDSRSEVTKKLKELEKATKQS